MIFDFDLTLADSTKGIIECFRYSLDKYGFEVPDDETIKKTIGLTIEDAFVSFIGKRDEELIKKLSDTYRTRADEVMTANTHFFDGVLGVLQLLKNAGVKLGIVSTKRRYRIAEAFERENNSYLIDEIIGPESVSHVKPDPEGLNRMIEVLGVDKSETLYTGDSYIDAETAKNAGVDFCGVLTGTTTKKDFSKYPSVAICDDLTGLLRNVF